MLTYGAELELADINRKQKLPEGFGWDVRDYSMVNSNGIAVDPKGFLYDKGGEINTPPANSIDEQVENFERILRLFPEATVNYRSNLHIHVRVPGLKNDLHALKALQDYIHCELKPMIGEIEPIPIPSKVQYPNQAAFEGAQWRYKRRKRSHQTFLTPPRVAHQLQAATIQEFMEREVPQDKRGNIMWHAQPRCCVNIRQLRETDTIEFRHFPGTLNSDEFRAATIWCREFLQAAVETGISVKDLWKEFSEKYTLPKFQPYQHELEVKYLMTCADGTVPKSIRKQNIKHLLGSETA